MLTILTTHPIQYQVPIWQALARRGKVDFEVWYLSDHGARAGQDCEFGLSFKWDIDLLEGYPHCLLSPGQATADIASFRGARLKAPGILFRDHTITALWIEGWRVQADWQAAFHAHRCGIPIWLRGETNDLRRPRRLKNIPRRLALSTLFQRIDAFLSIGSANRRFYKGFGVPDDQLHQAPYCVDNGRFAAATDELTPRRADLRSRWGIPEQATCLLFSGKLIPKKRPLDLILALRALIGQTPRLGREGRVHLLVVGDGELRQALTESAADLGHHVGRSLVTFAGFLNQSEIPQAYVAADCLVLPSDAGETWGLVVNEALACGRSVIVSDQCGCAEDLARPLGPDHIYSCGDIAQLTRCLHAQIERSGMDRRAEYAQLADAHDTLRTVETVEQLYAEALEFIKV